MLLLQQCRAVRQLSFGISELLLLSLQASFSVAQDALEARRKNSQLLGSPRLSLRRLYTKRTEFAAVSASDRARFLCIACAAHL